MRGAIVLFLIFWGFVSFIYAQQEKRIYLKNGNFFDAEILEQDQETLKIKLKWATMVIAKEDVLSIEEIPQRPRIMLPPPVKPVEEPEPPQREEKSTPPPAIGKTLTPMPEGEIFSLLEIIKSSPAQKDDVLGKIVDIAREDIQQYLTALEELSPPYLLWLIEIAPKIGIDDVKRSLVEKLDHESPEVRTETIFAISEIGDPVYTHYIARLLADPEADVRIAALVALEDMNATEYLEGITLMLLDEEEAVRKKASVCLQKMVIKNKMQKEVAQHLEKIIDIAKDEAIVDIINCSREMKVALPVERLREFLWHSSAEIKGLAAVVLGERNDTQSLEPLIENLLAEEDIWVKKQIIFALQKLRDLKAVPVLIDHLLDRDEGVKDAAAMALSNITGQHFGLDYERWLEWWQTAGGAR